TGQITAKARPGEAFDFEVERIVPLSQAKEGKNLFEVRGRLKQTAAWFRPGVEGLAKFNTESRSLAWIASRRILDQLKLWLWW
ncbi:MAG: diguanylate phosphodiesterase, partial [Acidobacteria bacterium]|nr:diguanylate phosphodiesterase [Acidobacteriota bacterium]